MANKTSSNSGYLLNYYFSKYSGTNEEFESRTGQPTDIAGAKKN